MDDHTSALFLYEEAMAYTYSAALRTAAALGVADHLDDTPADLGPLAEATGARPDALRRVLRLLASRGVFDEHPGDRFSLGDRGRALRGDSTAPASPGVLMFTDTMFWTMTHRLPESVRDARPEFARFFGRTLPEYLDSDPALDGLYYEGMATVSDAENALVVRGCELPAHGVVADLGGRNGSLLASALREHPGLSGVLFDRPGAVDTGRLEAAEDLRGRWRTAEGDFFTEVPPADVHLLKRILHNWDDEQSVRILENCRRALRPGGRVLVVDAIVPQDGTEHQGKAMDLMMLAALTGRERSAAELEPLFTEAGLRLSRVMGTSSVMSVAEGVIA
ncbi:MULTISPECIES: methyltransferase [Nocardiopsis]|uniref:Methyltransferase n=1 Tax=Nocardiopsis sinuspersici TaxID=501010 RepID=A0A1V3BY13_9ACTN|nr:MULTISPECIES: methyltransferase [Nocardiopsis]OOC53338.1 methyltransferase [Nocardiopsis sinuspersici]